MRIYITLIILCCIGIMPQTIADTDNKTKPTLYQQAQTALKNNDCKTAIKHLEKYKKENTNRINDYKEFFDQIDEQIELCKKKGADVRVTL